MTRAATATEHADHDRDLRKHEPRLTDLPSALTIACLAKGLDEADAAALIQKYADTIASIKVERAVSDAYTRVTRIIEGGFHPAKDDVHA